MSQSPVREITPESTQSYRQGWKALNRLLHEDRSFSGYERNCAFLNLGGKSFANVSSITGFDFADDARALVATDWDFDGDLDLWTTARTAPRLRFLKNNAGSPSGWIAFHLSGDGDEVNFDAVGARLELHLKGQDIPLLRTVHAGDAFLSQSSLWQHFAFPSDAELDRLVIHWPGGRKSTSHEDLQPRRHYLVNVDGGVQTWDPPAGRRELEGTDPELPASVPEARIVISGRLPLPPIYLMRDGGEVEMDPAELTGPLVINVWATWCGPCLEELSDWSSSADAFRKAGVRVLALNSESRLSEAASRVLQKLNFPFESADASGRTIRNLDIYQQSMMDRWTAMPVPTSFLVDPYGQVAVIYKGPVDPQQIIRDLELLEAPPEVLRDASVPFPGRWANPPSTTNPLLVNAQFVAYNQIQEGVKYLRRCAALAESNDNSSPQSIANIRYVIGVIENENGRIDEAISEYRTALANSPEDFRILRELAAALITKSRIGEALELLDRAAQVNAGNIELKRLVSQARYLEANRLRDSGRAGEAVASYKLALQNDPNRLDAANNLAHLLATTDESGVRNPLEAMALANRLCQITRNSNGAYLETFAIALAANNDFDQAVNAARMAMNLARDQGDAARVEDLSALIEAFQRGEFRP